MNDDILLTREQIGQALEYSNPSTAIKNLHRKHKSSLFIFCTNKIRGTPERANLKK